MSEVLDNSAQMAFLRSVYTLAYMLYDEEKCNAIFDTYGAMGRYGGCVRVIQVLKNTNNLRTPLTYVSSDAKNSVYYTDSFLTTLQTVCENMKSVSANVVSDRIKRDSFYQVGQVSKKNELPVEITRNTFTPILIRTSKKYNPIDFKQMRTFQIVGFTMKTKPIGDIELSLNISENIKTLTLIGSDFVKNGDLYEYKFKGTDAITILKSDTVQYSVKSDYNTFDDLTIIHSETANTKRIPVSLYKNKTSLDMTDTEYFRQYAVSDYTKHTAECLYAYIRESFVEDAKINGFVDSLYGSGSVVSTIMNIIQYMPEAITFDSYQREFIHVYMFDVIQKVAVVHADYITNRRGTRSVSRKHLKYVFPSSDKEQSKEQSNLVMAHIREVKAQNDKDVSVKSVLFKNKRPKLNNVRDKLFTELETNGEKFAEHASESLNPMGTKKYKESDKINPLNYKKGA
jgi:hypothetical protein